MDDQPPPTRQVPRAALPIVGEVVMDRYRVERMVGSGGMAHVLAAKHVQLGTDVAIKVLDPTLVNDLDAKERFAREAKAMAALSSKHSVRVYDVGHLASGLPFMVMELLIGHDLGQELKKRGMLPIEEACEYIDQACQALVEAHAAGIIHRDLKPQNLFLTKVKGQPMIRVLDFGIARSVGTAKLETITRMGDLIGTLHYMSPEQIRDSKAVEPRSDLWSLGACFYKLITGHPPFSHQGEAPLMSAILTVPPKPISDYRDDVPAVLSNLILRCLKKDPNERYPSAQDLRNALAGIRELLSADDFQAKTEILKKPAGQEPRAAFGETLASAGEAPKDTGRRKPMQATMPLAQSSAEVRAALAQVEAARPPSQPRLPSSSHAPPLPSRSSQPFPLPSQPITTSRPRRLMQGSPTTGSQALSFVMIIAAVAIGVFLAGLALLFVLARHH